MSFIVIKASSIVTMNVISGSGVFKHVLFVSTVALNDRCKMFCRVATSSAYYMLTDRVVDGTKCGPFTSDICLQGKCHVSTPPSSSFPLHPLLPPLPLLSPPSPSPPLTPHHPAVFDPHKTIRKPPGKCIDISSPSIGQDNQLYNRLRLIMMTSGWSKVIDHCHV